ncbi:MAG: hypothetical protein JNK21_09755 [Rhodospirillaceae bacterium]|nr:hypothetical protein [Rhodospirillaceae bacterium]
MSNAKIARWSRLLRRCAFAFLPTILGSASGVAKPISYVGGTMLMQEADETGYSLAADYTLSPKLAVGVFGKKEIKGDRYSFGGPQVNTLLKRWNLPDGQGNIFTMTGVGIARDNNPGPSRSHFAAWTGVLADYETRRIFTSYELRLMYADNIEKAAWQRARVGFAPYLANYNDVNTWLMIQVDHHPAKDRTTVVTPLVRVFYKTFLAEAGISSHGRLMFNWVQQF